MAKIRTLNQFQDKLDNDMSWRIKEISAFKISDRTININQTVFTRAGVAIVYAHWEGFVKTASEAYLEFVNNQNHTYRDLKSCFAVLGLKKELNNLGTAKQMYANISAFDFIIEQLDKPARMVFSGAIRTESNLNSKLFINIINSIGISSSPYETKQNLIDESLLRRRNKVAHGEYIDIDFAELQKLADEVLKIMRNYKIDLQNAATLKAYKR